MTIGTPLWDEFVANLKEVKKEVERVKFESNENSISASW